MANFTVNLDVNWKFCLALGAGISIPILALRMDAESAERLLSSGISAVKEYAIAA